MLFADSVSAPNYYTCQLEFDTNFDLFQWAHAEYEKCAELMVKAPKKYYDTPFAALNDLLKEWKEEDMADEDNDSSSSIEIENVEELKRPQRIKVL